MGEQIQEVMESYEVELDGKTYPGTSVFTLSALVLYISWCFLLITIPAVESVNIFFCKIELFNYS